MRDKEEGRILCLCVMGEAAGEATSMQFTRNLVSTVQPVTEL